MKHFNYVCVSGVLKSVGKLKDVGWFSCCAHVNVGEKRTTISVYATGERARELANYQIGNEVVVRGRLSLNPSGNLQISVEHIREYWHNQDEFGKAGPGEEFALEYATALQWNE